MTDWQKQYEELIEQGWDPEQLDPKQLDYIDKTIADDAWDIRCPNCGHYGMDYSLFVRGASHRAFYVCPDSECGDYEEL